MRGLFILGTNTEVGKTHITAMIARTLVAQGKKVGVYKPVASGCHRDEKGMLTSEDATHLWESAGRPNTLAQVCPQKFLAPLAPPQAAAQEGRQVDPQLLRSGITPWKKNCEIVLVEGVGGLLSPISEQDDNASLAADLKLPLLIVVPNQLGAINAARLTVLAARTLLPELPVVGIVLNQVRPRPEDASLASNLGDIQRWCETPVITTVQYGANRWEDQINWPLLCR